MSVCTMLFIFGCNPENPKTEIIEPSNDENQPAFIQEDNRREELWNKAMNAEAGCPIFFDELKVKSKNESNLLLVNFAKPKDSKIDAVQFIVRGLNNWNEDEDLISDNSLEIYDNQEPAVNSDVDNQNTLNKIFEKTGERMDPGSIKEYNVFRIKRGVTKVKGYILRVHFEDGTLWEAK